MFFKHHCRNLSVDFGAGQLFQQLSALLGFGVKEGGKLPLRQQHRTGKPSVIQPGERGGHVQFIFDFIGEDFSVGAAGKFHARDLQIAVRLITRPILAPERAVGFAFNFELDLCQTLGGVAGHQVVLRL
ncbi:hypothetical protein D3C73_1427330 [compost metagenome]